MSTDPVDRPTVERWSGDEDRLVSVTDVTYALTGQVVGAEGPRSTCTICDRRLEAGDVVGVEAVTQDGWSEWVPRLLKCTDCRREELTLDHGYFHQVLVRSMLLYTENVATESAHHALTNVSVVDFTPQGDGFYVDPATFDEEIRMRLDTSQL